MKVLKNNLAKNDIFVISGYGPFIFIRPSKYGFIGLSDCRIIATAPKENTSIAPLRSEGVLHADPTEKANILNRQFQSAFSSEANT
jgi:hypothetical protein